MCRWKWAKGWQARRSATASWSAAHEDIVPDWDRALAADRPTLLEMVTDPNVPPLPPHITYVCQGVVGWRQALAWA
jgi:hypothetical protein